MAALALATLAALCPAPARAGHYKVTYTASSPANGQAQEILPINNGPDPGYNYGNSHASGTITLTVHATAVWTPDGTGDASAPPPSQPFRETLSAFGVEGATGGGVTVDDGAGDQPVSSSTPIYYDGVVIQDTEQDVADGRHLLTGSGATITLPTRTMVVTFSGGASGTVGLCYAVEIDSRAVSISSSFDPTTCKGPSGTPIQNGVDSNGAMYADTYEPQDFSITYVANCSSGWFWTDNRDSYFLWYSSLNGYSDTGGFNPNGIDIFVCGYNNGEDYGTGPYATDHVYIHLTDSNDGANETADYYMRLHNEFENIQPTSNPGTQVDGPWQRVTGYAQQGPATGTISIPITLSAIFSDSASSSAVAGNPANPPTNIIYEYGTTDVAFPYLGVSFETPASGTFSATIPAND